MANSKSLRLAVGSIFPKGPGKVYFTVIRSMDGEKPSRSKSPIAPKHSYEVLRQIGDFAIPFLHPFDRPAEVEGADQAVVDAELARFAAEDQRLVPAGADDGAELAEVHDGSELLDAFRWDV